MPVTFGSNLPLGFALALRQHVFTIQVHADPQVEWNWRFAPAIGGIDVHLRIPAKNVDQASGWGEGKQFGTDISIDAKAARMELSTWFDRIHAQFRKETG